MRNFKKQTSESSTTTNEIDLSDVNRNLLPKVTVTRTSNRVKTRLVIKAIFFITGVLVVTAVFLLYHPTYTIGDESRKSKESRDTCQSTSCYKATKSILSHLNETVDPCENFHDFVCGHWCENEAAETDLFNDAHKKVLADL